ncbi:aldehyde dehydrogenase family protein [Fischerella thermalis]|jgi:acyl-CoA reductase-like NAD-dependent aldehyde dehydrogenase|uniref:aldehyde dehydrogenase (NAD(+)) n=1 Tax=Fischerella thermalis JSC-11 TaxID=741277 RepID=G6FYU3_9CYAN|nr:aldehyde dehydrogenase family protein [Fischerella thermalis]PMB02157.1 aldehyde dehydrogenase [Fischerella thermalis CCMEE 5328]PMB43551.1 aldehyde dehydrogenase [Fischerella thermalis CCMEE 5205]EHC09405.1 Aldehyde Dehydrogenase [Fischerella thermalis JSC-11]PLZ07778.1 aldehyde dehydrogenase [Fischerella thermalis WC119]PLZ22299.1 aldehyde dehydrogenase [Fischerella thermalis WC341]
MSTPQTCRNYINGQWLTAVAGATLESRNPANKREVIATFPRSTGTDVEAAVVAARQAYQIWRLVPAPARAEYVFKVGELLSKYKEELAQLICREMGKPIAEARGDVQEGIDCAFYSAAEGRRLFGQTTPSEMPNKFAMTVRMPIGVCALITPWNFPIAIPCWKAMPALVCGNTVIFKPAEDTPACATKLVEIFAEAGLPPGVMNLVHGVGEEVGKALVAHPHVDLVSFTGSSETGAEVGSICGQTHKRVCLEMGGKNAQIVMEDADLELALDGAVWGAFGTAGQRCTATSRLILHQDIKEKFTAMLKERTSKLRLGAGSDPNTQVGPIINERQLQRISQYLDIARAEGAKVLIGGKIATEGELENGYFFQPTILDEVTPQMRVAQEEIFGPVVALIKVNSFEEAISILNNTKYGLSSSIYTRDINRAFTAMRDIEAGITYINGPTIGAEVHLPFGGVKQTGNGHREAGTTTLDVFTEWKTVYVDFSGSLQRAQIDNRK